MKMPRYIRLRPSRGYSSLLLIPAEHFLSLSEVPNVSSSSSNSSNVLMSLTLALSPPEHQPTHSAADTPDRNTTPTAMSFQLMLAG